MTRTEFEEYLRAADLHSIKNYKCDRCGVEPTSRSNLQGSCSCGGKVKFVSQPTYEDVFHSEYSRFKAAGLISW